MIGQTIRLEDGLNGVLLWTEGVIVMRHNFPWLKMEASGPFWVAKDLIRPLEDLW